MINRGLTAALALTFACGEATESASKPTGFASTTSESLVAAPSTSASASVAALAPPSAELQAKLDAGASCKWDSDGLLSLCTAREELEKYVDANMTSVTLDGCLAATREKIAATRLMAAACTHRFFFQLRADDRKAHAPRAFDAVLAAMVRPDDSVELAGLAHALSLVDAQPAKKVDEVLSGLKGLDPARDGKAMAGLLDTLFWYGMTDEPPKSAVDVALMYATSLDLSLRMSAYGLLQYATSRSLESCPLLASATTTDKTGWTAALGALVELGEPCKRELGAVNRALLKRLDEAANSVDGYQDRISSWGELRGYVKSELVSKGDRDAIAKAADKVVKAPKTSSSDRQIAQTLAAEARGKSEKP